MRVWIPFAILAVAVGAVAVVGLRPSRDPYPFATIHASASDYWIEYREGSEGVLQGWGASWPIPDYYGESARLWRLRPRGLDEEFLILDHVLGAYTLRRHVWHIRSDTDLFPAADYVTVGEIHGDGVDDVLKWAFEDVDGDGVDEIRCQSREFLTDDGELIDNWAVRYVYLRWTGDAFKARWARLSGLGQVGPLVKPDDPRSQEWKAAGLTR